MRYFPIFLDLEGKHAVVVGGGEEAVRKVRLLLKTTIQINMIADEMPAELFGHSQVHLVKPPYNAQHLAGATLVLSADAALNAQVSVDAQRLGIPVNAVDDAAISTFIIPSIVDRDPVVIAIGTEGTAPVLGQNLRAKIDALLPQTLGKLARTAANWRARVAEVVPHGTARRKFWSTFFSNDIASMILSNDSVAAKLTIEDTIYASSASKTGRISIINVSSNDPELLTIKAQRRLMEADVIVFDNGTPSSMMEMARRDANRIAMLNEDAAPILQREASLGQQVVFLTTNRTAASDHRINGVEVEVLHTVNVPSADVLPFPNRSPAAQDYLKVAK